MYIFNRFIFCPKDISQRYIKYSPLFIRCFADRNFVKLNNLLFLNISRSKTSYESKTGPGELMKPKEIAIKERVFHQVTIKNKDSFLRILETFTKKDSLKRGHVEFIFAAMKHMEEFDAKYDLEVYKKLLDIFPKGKMISKNLVQAEFEHFPRQQDCAVEVLDEMEYNGVYPDLELKEIILNIFGKSSVVYKKYCRMMYWMPKFRNKNPYLPAGTLPSDIEELAQLALRRMSVDPRTKISNFKTVELESSLDKTWIVSAQSPMQQRLLLDHSIDKPLYVDGPYLVWLRRLSLSYFVLKGDPLYRQEIEIDDDDVSNLKLYMFGEPKPKELAIAPQTVHEQEDATIFGLCATGTSSKDSVVSWIHFLKQSNPILDKIPILFKLRSAQTALTTLNVSPDSKESIETENLLKDVKNTIKEMK